MDAIEEFASILMGPAVSLLVSWLKMRSWPNAVKVGITLLFSLIASIVTTLLGNYLEGTVWSWGDWVKNAGLIFTAATTFYKTVFQGTNLDRELTDHQGPHDPPFRLDNSDPGAFRTKAQYDYARSKGFNPDAAMKTMDWDRFSREQEKYVHLGVEPPDPHEDEPEEEVPGFKNLNWDGQAGRIELDAAGGIVRNTTTPHQGGGYIGLRRPQEAPGATNGAKAVSQDPPAPSGPRDGRRRYSRIYDD